MPVAQPLDQSARHSASHDAHHAGAKQTREAEKPAVARLADDQTAPAPSPVHRLQAGLAQWTSPPQPLAEAMYPGWLRITFPVVTSITLWAAILWGVSTLA